ncbi:histidine kinase [Actinoplanes sp. NPDC048988]|uniref:histidine kinase n=1 Tax=Actinoplanes sp. NPDC048988 TaxID=3363901 RepID=UPI00371EADB6
MARLSAVSDTIGGKTRLPGSSSILLSFGLAVHAVGHRLVLRQALPWAVAALAIVLVHTFTGPPGLVGLVPGTACVIVPFTLGAARRLVVEAQSRERAATERRTADAERLRLSQEVHDVVGHGLAAIQMHRPPPARHPPRPGPRGPDRDQRGGVRGAGRTARHPGRRDPFPRIGRRRGAVRPPARGRGVGDAGRGGLAVHATPPATSTPPATATWPSTFTVHAVLPRTLAPPTHPTANPAGAGRAAAAFASGGAVISVLIADDQDLVRMGLRVLFRNEDGFAVAAEAADGLAAVDQARRTRPDDGGDGKAGHDGELGHE